MAMVTATVTATVVHALRSNVCRSDVCRWVGGAGRSAGVRSACAVFAGAAVDQVGDGVDAAP